jgi:DDE superfamily endonuclease
MVRKTLRKQVLDRLDEIIATCAKHCIRLHLYGLPTGMADEMLLRCRDLRSRINSRRYLFRGHYRKRTSSFERFLGIDDHDNALSDKEFRFHFRLSRHAFWELVNLLKDHESFRQNSSDSRGPLPKPASHQLLVLLKYYGSEGNQASSLALSNFFGVAAGVIDACRNNALQALLSLEDQTYIWPDAAERRLIANRIKAVYKFPNCVGIIDGTLLPLASRPLVHGENYLSRKKFYAIVMLVVCDDKSRILYYHVGWPGSVHDNRVWRNCRLYRHHGQFFSKRQYLLGDSAFTASSIMIPPFKSRVGANLSTNRTAFNTLLAKPRVKSEHCIGILKGRFPLLRDIRLKIATKQDMDRVVDYVRGSVILHNFLRTDDTEEEEWIDVTTQHEGEDDLEPEPSTASNQGDYGRRDELYYYLSELEDTAIN